MEMKLLTPGLVSITQTAQDAVVPGRLALANTVRIGRMGDVSAADPSDRSPELPGKL